MKEKPTRTPKMVKGATSEEREFERRLRKETQRLVREHISAKNEEFATVLAGVDQYESDDYDDPIVVELVKRISRHGEKGANTTLRAYSTYGVNSATLAKLLDVSRAHGYTFRAEGQTVNAEVTRISFDFTYGVADEVYGMLESQARTAVQEKLVAERNEAVDTSSATA